MANIKKVHKLDIKKSKYRFILGIANTTKEIK